MGLDMYLEKRKELSNNGGSCYNLRTNPLVKTVEITSVGYWRKAYDLDETIARATDTDADENCRYIYVDYDAMQEIVNEAESYIEDITEDLNELNERLAGMSEEQIRNSPTQQKIDDLKWDLADWEDARDIFTKCMKELEDDSSLDFYYYRWY